jgi:hypothetical protein
MPPASTKAGGQAMGNPNVCKVPAPPGPPIPTPLPNMIDLTQAQGVSKKVKFAGAAVITVASKVPRSMGDEAGVAGGVVSGVNMGPGTFKVGVPKVQVEGNAVVVPTKTTGHNGTNANMPAGMVAVPSQTKVLINE